MGFDLSGSDGSSTDSEPSGTHLYFYEEGHERLPENDEIASTIAEAYELAGTSPDGPVRTLANRGWEGGLQHMLAEFVISVGSLIEEESPEPVVSWVMESFDEEEQVEAVAQFLDDNPEVGRELAERLETTEATTAGD